MSDLEKQARKNMIKAVGYKAGDSFLDSLPQEEHNEPPTRILIKQIVAEEMARYHNQRTAESVSGEKFYRQQSYISTLVQVQGVEHNVHAELTEAIEKLKELTYA